MQGRTKRALVFAITAALILTTTGFHAVAQDQEPGDTMTAGGMVADFVLLRPMGIAATALGTAFFIASLPFSCFGGNAKAAFEKLVAEPARFAFKRPLGETEYY